MFPRLAAVLAIVALVIGLLAYSQYRATPSYVSGFVESDEIRVGSRVGGRVLQVLVEEGQRVAAGEILFELEPFDLVERERQAESTLAERDADYQRLVNGLRPEEVAQAKARYEQAAANLDALRAGPRREEIQAAEARVGVAEAEQTLASRKYERRRELYEQGSVTREEYDSSIEELQAADGTLAVRREELALLNQGTREEDIRAGEARAEEARQAFKQAEAGNRAEDIQAAKAARDAAAAALAAIREQKQELTVRSPVDGVVEALDLQKGDLAPAGAPVLSVMDDANLWVRAYVPQNRVALEVGQRLPIEIDGLPDEKIVGEITFIARQAEFTPNNVQTSDERAKQVYRIKVELPKGIDQVRPGMTASVGLTPVDTGEVGASP